ncbi:MAG TPA: hypothetical protein PKC62_07860 [Ferruginibacter sp.]|jgi:hypothetical protein|nr:hypothetical protein [Bacteroidota bacterium]MBS1926663.1 hypothetical protein [Bacteroidota bacterium]MCC6691892.1 hypothetical protein [Chitinophagaceae bacterium]HMT96589.1 hypothetical protein [Ferruginibacter sp.]HMU25006.1 hypothetical protein [Ferruginibacter sp.]
MKKLILLFTLALPMWLCAQNKEGKKNKLTVIALHPLQNESDNFEKGLAQHNKMFHSGDAAIDIYQVLTGDRTGEFHFVYRNLASWADVDKSFEAVTDKAHAQDWDNNVGKYVSTNAPRYYYVLSDDSYMSPNRADMESEMLGLYFIELNPGMEDDFYAGLKKIKEMYKLNKSKNYYQIFSRSFGTNSQLAVVFPLPNGWASFEPNADEDWSKMFKVAFPKEDFKLWEKKFNATQKNFESMVIKRRADLSSPR